MNKLIDIISPIYQDLLEKCARKKISINLDIQDLTKRIPDEEAERIADFYKKEIRRALKLCEPGDKITLSQNAGRYSVKNSAKASLDTETITKLREDGYEVRARFGYDTIISLNI